MTAATLSRKLGLGKSQVERLIARGMPTDSVANAEQWRIIRAKNQKTGAKPRLDSAKAVAVSTDTRPTAEKAPPTVKVSRDESTLDTMAQLKNRISTQSQMAQEAQERFLEALKGNDVLEAKQAGEMNNATQKTLIMLEAEYQRRLMENGTLLTLDSAAGRFEALLGDLRQYIDQGEQEFSSLTNPENPARGLLGYREFKQRVYTRLQKMIHA